MLGELATPDSLPIHEQVGGVGRHIKWELERPLSGEFEIRSRIRCTSLGGSAICFVFWSGAGESQVDHVGFDGAHHNGASWLGHGRNVHWRSQRYGPAGQCPLQNGTWHEVKFARTNGRLAVTVDGARVEPFHGVNMDFNPVAIGWRPHRATIELDSLRAWAPQATTGGDAAAAEEEGSPMTTAPVYAEVVTPMATPVAVAMPAVAATAIAADGDGAGGGGGGGGGKGLVERLRELNEAKKEGLITESEFQAGRAKILGDI